MPTALVCTDDELTLTRPMWALTGDQRVALEAWLLDHGIHPDRLVLGTTICRDKLRRRLSWFEAGEDGPSPRMFLRFGGPSPEWPTPFPNCLLDA